MPEDVVGKIIYLTQYYVNFLIERFTKGFFNSKLYFLLKVKCYRNPVIISRKSFEV